jgi:hypothetical protein
VSRFERRPYHGEELCCFWKRLKYSLQREQQLPRNGREIHTGILWSLWSWAVQRVRPKWNIIGNIVYVDITCCLNYATVSLSLHRTDTLQYTSLCVPEITLTVIFERVWTEEMDQLLGNKRITEEPIENAIMCYIMALGISIATIIRNK